jgi:hypothetical protein
LSIMSKLVAHNRSSRQISTISWIRGERPPPQETSTHKMEARAVEEERGGKEVKNQGER